MLPNMDEHYSIAELVEIYDDVNSLRKDFAFYLKVLPETGSEILDIGCGTGTLALLLAERGCGVTAVDPAPQMIAAAKRKDVHNRVSWRTGFVSDLSSGIRFDAAVMSGHAIQCLLSDQDIIGLFQHVRDRLKANSCFWFETRNPDAKPWLRWTPEHTGAPLSLDGNRTVRVIHDVLSVVDDLVTFEEQYHFTNPETCLTSRSTLRFFNLDTLERLAHAAGLELMSVYGDWSKDPLTNTSPEIIVQLSTTG